MPTPQNQHETSSVGVLNSRYHLIRPLGRGGFATVYLAEDRILGKRVAIKVIGGTGTDPSLEESVRREFFLLSRLSHPNLVKVFDFARIERAEPDSFRGMCYYTMEYLDGKSSADLFQTYSMINEKQELLTTILLQLLGVLRYIHREGIIHFDIKPANLIVVENENSGAMTVKLTDFGLCAQTIEMMETPLRGTLQYAAPEVIEGKPADHRLDLYSLGLTIHELYNGRFPFEGSNSVEFAKQILTRPLLPLEPPSSQISKTVEKLCEKNPADRYAAAEEALKEFRDENREEDIKSFVYFATPVGHVRRESESRVIEQARKRLQDRSGRNPALMMVRGAAGIGKSQSLRAISDAISSCGFDVWTLSLALPDDPYGALAEFLDFLSLRDGSKETDRTPTNSSAFA
ncbi:MAG TPA: serine/threonine-protein kinase, partial [Bacteroidota bacterium]|nr:serine/threonine-protein kinase [Bacteroidota bacterium]